MTDEKPENLDENEVRQMRILVYIVLLFWLGCAVIAWALWAIWSYLGR